MEHAVRAEKRAAAKLEGDELPGIQIRLVRKGRAGTQRGGAGFGCSFFLHIFETHGLRSWFPFIRWSFLWRGL
jgi:hypothetical protein